MAWADRVEELLYEGEQVRSRVDVGEHRVVVTSHRLLAFTPTVEAGPNYRAIDLPNVAGVSAAYESDMEALQKAILWGVSGFVLVVGGIAFEMGQLFTLPANLESGAVGGTGGIVSGFRTLVELLSLFDEALAVVGVALVGVAGYFAYRYVESREHVVTIAVAGGDDVRLPVSAGAADQLGEDDAEGTGGDDGSVAEDAAADLRAALGAGGTGSTT